MGFLTLTVLLLPIGVVVAAATRRYAIAAALGTLIATGLVFVSTVIALIAIDALPFMFDTPPAPWAYPLLYGLTTLTFVVGALLTATKARRADRRQRPAVSDSVWGPKSFSER